MVAEFERASDAASAALSFQAANKQRNEELGDDIRPQVRVGIAIGEVVIADQTVTGAGVVLAQRLERLAEPGGLCISAAIPEALPSRLPFEYGPLGERKIKGFDEPVRVFFVALDISGSIPAPEPLIAPNAVCGMSSRDACAVREIVSALPRNWSTHCGATISGPSAATANSAMCLRSSPSLVPRAVHSKGYSS